MPAPAFSRTQSCTGGNLVGDKSKIEWTEATWNPVGAFLKEDHLTIGPDGGPKIIPAGTRGWFCTKVSPGCAHCYAEGINVRLGNGLQYLPINLDKIEFRLVNLDQPLRWKRPRMIFVNSMTDLFHEAIPDAMIDQVYAVMALADRHTFQVLTKRAQRMRDYFMGDRVVGEIHGRSWRIREAGHALGVAIGENVNFALPIRNVWLGVSAEDQERANERIPLLLETPAAIRFLSCEPLLGQIDATKIWMTPSIHTNPLTGTRLSPAKIDWAIIGGESGPKARPCHVEWISDLVRQCQEAGVAPFVKQLGSVPVTENANLHDWPDDAVLHAGKPNDDGFAFAYVGLHDRKGGDWSEWPEDLRVRGMP